MVYVLGVDQPVEEFTGVVIAVVKHDNAADKLVVAPEGVIYMSRKLLKFSALKKAVPMSSDRCSYEKSCGAVLFLEEEGIRRYFR